MKFNYKFIFSFLLASILVFSQFTYLVSAAGEGAPKFAFTSENQEDNGKMIYQNVQPGDVIKTSFEFQLLEDVPANIGMNFNSYVDNEEIPERLNLSSWAQFPDGFGVSLDGLSDSEEVPVEIHVPEDAYPGDYKGAFIASVTGYGNEIKGKGFDGGMGAVVKVGKGVAFLMRVAGELVESMLFENMAYDLTDDGSLTLRLDYKNIGNVLVRPTARVRVSSVFGGEKLLDKDFELASVAPGNEVKNNLINLSESDLALSYGVYSVDVDLNYQALSLFDTDEEKIVNLAGVASMTVYRLPLMFIVIFSALILIVVLYFVWRAVSLSKLKASCKVYVVQPGDTLQIISTRFQVDPKLIIRVNSLKAPYFLTVNQQILLPASNS